MIIQKKYKTKFWSRGSHYDEYWGIASDVKAVTADNPRKATIAE